MTVRVMSLCFMLAVNAPGAQDEPVINPGLTDAREILQRADAAMRTSKTARYTGDYEATGWVQAFVPSVKGFTVIGPTAAYDVPVFFTKVTIKKAGSEETRQVSAGCDGNEYFLLDPKTKMAHQDMDPAVMGPDARDIQRLVLPEFSAKEPLKDELAAESVELKESVEIGDVDCYQVRADLGEKSPRAKIWFISKKDFLPRKVVRIYVNEEGKEATTELTMTDLSASESFVVHPFQLVVPKGYTRTDEFAPS